jgi:hypothetical protein
MSRKRNKQPNTFFKWILPIRGSSVTVHSTHTPHNIEYLPSHVDGSRMFLRRGIRGIWGGRE